MAQEKLDVGNLFPTFDQFRRFLQKQPRRNVEIEPSNISKYTDQVRIVFTTSAGVVNNVDGYKNGSDSGPKIHLYNLNQEYEGPEGYKRHTCVNKSYISSALFIPSQKTDKTALVGVISESTFWPNHQEWHPKQQVFTPLTPGYLALLKKEGIVPKKSKGRLWIQNRGGEISAIIEDGGVLSEESLLRICDEIGLDFQINENEGVTRGKFDGFEFELRHVNPRQVNRERIWDAMTGKNPLEPFVFPAKVTRIQ